MEIGEKIKERRCEIGLLQTELANRMGVTRSTVCKVEKGLEANLTIDRIKAFADALGCSIYDLINEKPTATEDKQTAFIEFKQSSRRITLARKQIVAIIERPKSESYIICTDSSAPYPVCESYDEVIRKIKGGE